MIDKQPNDAQEKDMTQTAAEADGASSVAARRSMLKKSVGLAPIVLTLASRPVLAARCRSPSAWGSNPVNATVSNHAHTETTFVAWTVRDWQNNTAQGGLGQPWSKFTDFGNLLLNQLPGLDISLPYGVGDTGQKVVNFLANAGTFQKILVVAQLNRKFVAGIGSCVTTAMLQEMASGSFRMSASVTWDQSGIMSYLQSNGIATP
jgi:hypothetical protein